MTDALFSMDVIKSCLDNLCRTNPLEPIEVEGRKYFLMCVHPDQHYKLRVMLAKFKYKHERWLERYNRWRASRGEPPCQEIEPEVGVFDGVNFK